MCGYKRGSEISSLKASNEIFPNQKIDKIRQTRAPFAESGNENESVFGVRECGTVPSSVRNKIGRISIGGSVRTGWRVETPKKRKKKKRKRRERERSSICSTSHHDSKSSSRLQNRSGISPSSFARVSSSFVRRRSLFAESGLFSFLFPFCIVRPNKMFERTQEEDVLFASQKEAPTTAAKWILRRREETTNGPAYRCWRVYLGRRNPKPALVVVV